MSVPQPQMSMLASQQQSEYNSFPQELQPQQLYSAQFATHYEPPVGHYDQNASHSYAEQFDDVEYLSTIDEQHTHHALDIENPDVEYESA